MARPSKTLCVSKVGKSTPEYSRMEADTAADKLGRFTVIFHGGEEATSEIRSWYRRNSPTADDRKERRGQPTRHFPVFPEAPPDFGVRPYCCCDEGIEKSQKYECLVVARTLLSSSEMTWFPHKWTHSHGHGRDREANKKRCVKQQGRATRCEHWRARESA